MTTENNNEGGEPKLFAGKFKTVEDLEAGYKNSAVVFDENTTLKKKLEEVTTVPDVYANPAEVADLESNRIADIQARAKDAGMTQAQYEKFVRNEKARVENSKNNFEKARKEVGEETTNLLNDYVSKHYPKELQQGILNTLITNKEARTAALNHRQQLLNNTVPGVRGVTPPIYGVTDDDVRKAYVLKEKTKMPKDINRYLNLVAAQAEQRGTAN